MADTIDNFVDPGSERPTGSLTRRSLVAGGLTAGGILLSGCASSASPRTADMREPEMQRAGDIVEITQLIIRERFNRDKGKSREFREAYFEDSRVKLAWFEGSGWEFVDASMKQHAGRKTVAMHLVSAIPVKLYGDRAIVPATLTILARPTLGNTEVQLSSVTTAFYGVEKRQGRWGIVSLECNYEGDTITPIIPGERVELDRELLASFRPSYRYISYFWHTQGRKLDQNLAGSDRPELLTELENRLEAWARTGT